MNPYKPIENQPISRGEFLKLTALAVLGLLDSCTPTARPPSNPTLPPSPKAPPSPAANPTATLSPVPPGTPTKEPSPTPEPTATPEPTQTPEPTPTPQPLVLSAELIKKGLSNISGPEMVLPLPTTTPSNRETPTTTAIDMVNYANNIWHLPDEEKIKLDPSLPDKSIEGLKYLLGFVTASAVENGPVNLSQTFPQLTDKNNQPLVFPKLTLYTESDLMIEDGSQPPGMVVRPKAHLTIIGQFEGKLAVVFGEYIRDNTTPRTYLCLFSSDFLEELANTYKLVVAYDKKTGTITFGNNRSIQVNQIDESLFRQLSSATGAYFVDKDSTGKLHPNPLVNNPPEGLIKEPYTLKLQNGNVAAFNRQNKQIAVAEYNKQTDRWQWREYPRKIKVGSLEVPDPRESNPELFDLKKADAPIPQFVEAMKGIANVTGEMVINGLKFEQRTGANNQPRILATYTTTGNKTTYTIGFVAENNKKGEWEWRELEIRDAETFNNLIIGGLIDMAQDYDNPYYQKRVKIFSILFPAGSYFEFTFDNYPGVPQEITSLANRNNQLQYIHPGFFHLDESATLNHIMKIKDITELKTSLNEYVRNRLKNLIDYAAKTKRKPTYLALTNELTWYDPQTGKAGIHEGNPLKTLYNNDPVLSLTEIYLEAYKIAQEHGLTPGEDIIFTYSVSPWGIEIQGETDYNLSILKDVIKQLKEKGIKNPIIMPVIQLRFDAKRRDPSNNEGRYPYDQVNFRANLEQTLKKYTSLKLGCGLTEICLLDADRTQISEFNRTIVELSKKYGCSFMIYEDPINNRGQERSNPQLFKVLNPMYPKDHIYYQLLNLLVLN